LASRQRALASRQGISIPKRWRQRAHHRFARLFDFMRQRLARRSVPQELMRAAVRAYSALGDGRRLQQETLAAYRAFEQRSGFLERSAHGVLQGRWVI
jgi:hypothetical protein